MKQAPLDSELAELFSAICEGTASEQQTGRLESLALSDDDVCRSYLNFLALHGSLGTLHAERTDELNPNQLHAGPSPIASPAVLRAAALPGDDRRVRRSAQVLATAASLLLVGYFVGMAVFVSLRDRSSRFRAAPLVNEEGASLGAEGTSVATVLSSEHVQWSPDSQVTAEDRLIESGKSHKIDSGLVELQLRQGATLIIEGPSEWTIDGKNNATLKQGKLVAKVPPMATGFTLNTPLGTVIDLGTEFGVRVGQQSAEFRVFVGKVEVQPASGAAGQSARPRTTLVAGEVAQIVGSDQSPAANLVKVGNGSEHFVRSLAAGRRTMSERSAEAVRSFGPTVYLRLAPNEKHEILSAIDGAMSGRLIWEGEQAPEFEQAPFGPGIAFRGPKFNDRVCLDAAAVHRALNFSAGGQPARPFTLSCWARVIGPQHGAAGIVCKGDGGREQYCLDSGGGAYRFFVRNNRGPESGIVQSRTPVDGTWQHLACVFDPVRKRLALYVNGGDAAAAELADTTLLSVDEPVTIGGRTWSTGPIPQLSLRGTIAEVAVFPVSLSKDEIHQLYLLQSSGASHHE